MIYVDAMEAPFGRMLLSHMIGYSTEELLQMVDKIGVSRRWIQSAGTAQEHFDISKGKKAIAIEYGAKEVTRKELAAIVRSRGEDLNTNYKEEICLSI